MDFSQRKQKEDGQRGRVLKGSQTFTLLLIPGECNMELSSLLNSTSSLESRARYLLEKKGFTHQFHFSFRHLGARRDLGACLGHPGFSCCGKVGLDNLLSGDPPGPACHVAPVSRCGVFLPLSLYGTIEGHVGQAHRG